MFCPKCGKIVTSENKFCGECGTLINTIKNDVVSNDLKNLPDKTSISDNASEASDYDIKEVLSPILQLMFSLIAMLFVVLSVFSNLYKIYWNEWIHTEDFSLFKMFKLFIKISDYSENPYQDVLDWISFVDSEIFDFALVFLGIAILLLFASIILALSNLEVVDIISMKIRKSWLKHNYWNRLFKTYIYLFAGNLACFVTMIIINIYLTDAYKNIGGDSTFLYVFRVNIFHFA